MNFGYAKSKLAKYVGTGISDPEDSRVAEAINEANGRLLAIDKGEFSSCLIQICAYRGSFTLSREFEKCIKTRVNGVLTYPMDKWYEFLEYGPGLLEDGGTGWLDPIDRGIVCTQYDIPREGMNIMVYSDREEDEDASIRIMGKDNTGRDIMFNGNMGEVIPIRHETNVLYSTNKFSIITSIQKSRTNGYTYLSAWDPDDYTRFHLSCIHPHDTEPKYRRYQFYETAALQAHRPDESNYKTHRVDALVGRKHVELIRDEEIMPVPVLPSLKRMLQAMHKEDTFKLKEAEQLEHKAGQLLQREEALKEHKRLQVDASEGWGMGDVESQL